MTGRLRKVTFLIFVAVYFVAAPLTILYALGYLFSPIEQKLLQTGLISLNTEPPRADVWINGSPMKEKTPTVIRNLRPGIHEIRLTFANRRPWHKTIEVKPDRALRLENILLFPLSFEPETLGNAPVFGMWHTSGGRYLLVLEGEQASALSLFDLEEKKFRKIFSSRYREAKVHEVHLHPNGDRAVIILEKDKVFLPMLVKFSRPIRRSDLTDFLQQPFEELKWSPHHKDRIFFLKQNTLVRVDLAREAVHPALLKGARGYTIDNQSLYVLDEGGRFLELTEKGRIRSILLDDPAKARLIFGAKQSERYAVSFLPSPSVFPLLSDALALFLSEDGRLFSNKLPYFLDESVDEFSLSGSHLRAVYRKGSSLWAVDFEREQGKDFFQSGPAARRIYSGKRTLGTPVWFYNDQYLLFSDGNRIMFQDFEEENDAIEILRTSSTAKDFVLDHKRGFLYYSLPKGGQLARVKLFEESGLLPRLVDGFAEATKEPQ